MSTLAETAQKMVRPPGGILAADESIGTMGDRLGKIGIIDDPKGPPTWRDAWREVMFGANLTPAVNAVILFEEQLRNAKLVGMLQNQGVVVGVKIDTGLDSFNGSDVEQITKGVDDGLSGRLAEYYALGARFTKFRSFLHIDLSRGFPSTDCILANSEVQAEFARASQDAGLVPMVEPEST